jgi:uncharacterized protein (TIGR03083 family)
MANPWPAVHAERRALADDLGKLTDQQWQTPSLCSGWTVRQVLGHLTAAASTNAPRFFGKLIGSGFRFNAMADKDVATYSAGGGLQTLERFRGVVSSTAHPPGPAMTWLGETIVHAEDIRRPLGIKHDYARDALADVASFYKGSNLIIGAKKRIAGLQLKATDGDWSTGEGAEVSGPLASLILAMTGRKAALDDLSGPGVATLRGRS